MADRRSTGNEAPGAPALADRRARICRHRQRPRGGGCHCARWSRAKDNLRRVKTPKLQLPTPNEAGFGSWIFGGWELTSGGLRFAERVRVVTDQELLRVEVF